MSNRTIQCPHCGKDLVIPGDAEKIVCMFCAKPIDLNRLNAAPDIPETGGPGDGDYEQEISLAKELMTDEVFSWRIRLNHMNVKVYPGKFEEYEKEIRPALSAFRRAVQFNEDRAVEEFAEFLFQGFVRQTEASKSNADSFDCRFSLVALTLPAIMEQQVPAAEKLADRFLEKWNGKYPKNPIGKTTYDKILGGFKKKLCFITTAACSALGKPETCEELNEFRAFRDGWLSATASGRSKITEYYLFAPILVDSIGENKAEYLRIWGDYLVPCLSDLRAGRNGECEARYEAMMGDLEKKWLRGKRDVQ